MEKKDISIWTVHVQGNKKPALPSFADKTAEIVTVSQDKLSANLKEFLESSQAITEIDMPKESSFYIDEMELSLAINAKGGIELVGKLEAGAQAGIKIKLKRKAK